MIKRFLAAALMLALLFLCAVPVLAESEDGPIANSRGNTEGASVVRNYWA